MTINSYKWWEETHEYYNNEVDIPPEIHYGPGAPLEPTLQVFEEIELSEKKILEIGCGAANCSRGFKQRGATPVGIDISKSHLEIASENTRKTVPLIQADCRTLPFDNSVFDIAFSAYVFEWVDDWEKTFSETHRVIKDDGYFIFSVPHPAHRMIDGDLNFKNSYFDSGKRRRKENELENIEEMITYSYTIGETINFLTNAGFKILNIIEPDSRKDYENDPWKGMWNYTEKSLRKVPPTIIYVCEPTH